MSTGSSFSGITLLVSIMSLPVQSTMSITLVLPSGFFVKPYASGSTPVSKTAIIILSSECLEVLIVL